MVQISWVLYDTSTRKLLEVKDFIVRLPEDQTLSEDSIRIHGITNERMRKVGVDVRDVIGEFTHALDMTDILVAHNIDFDLKTVQAEMARNGCVNYFDMVRLKTHCTMKNNVDLCKIPAISKRTGGFYYKWPKLAELHEYIFGYVPKNLHNSLHDVYVCLRCYCMLNEGVDIVKTNRTFASLYHHLI
jgi:DNA polymerase III epsilon subunit-like protein